MEAPFFFTNCLKSQQIVQERGRICIHLIVE